MLRLTLITLLVGCGKIEGTMPLDTGESQAGVDTGDSDGDGGEEGGGEESGGETGGSSTGGSSTGGETGGSSTGGSSTGGSSTGGETGGSSTGGSSTGGSSTGGSSTGGSSTGGSSTGGSSGAGTGGSSGGSPPGGSGGLAEPGAECRTDHFFDCDLNCISDDPYDGWLGDGFCDEGISANLNCVELDYDYGDCVEETPPEEVVDAVIGEDCSEGRIYDCALNCVSSSTAELFRVDSFCDGEDEAFGYHLDCAEFEFDAGACDEESGGDDEPALPDDWAPAAECGADRVYDCAGNCVLGVTAESWAVDSLCDGEDEAYGMHLDCAEFGYDDGACEDDYEDPTDF